MDPRRRPSGRQAELVDRDRHAARVRVGHLDVGRDHEGGAGEAHRADPDVVPERRQLLLQRGDLRVGVPAAHDAQARRLLAEPHAGVLRAADAHADDRGLAREAAPAELDERVHEEALDAADAVGREEHPVVAAEQAALVDGGEIEPVRVRLEGVGHLGGVDADVVVVVRAREGVDAVRSERDRRRRVGRRAPERAVASTLAYYIGAGRVVRTRSGASPRAHHAAASPPAPSVTNAQPHAVGEAPGGFVTSRTRPNTIGATAPAPKPMNERSARAAPRGGGPTAPVKAVASTGQSPSAAKPYNAPTAKTTARGRPISQPKTSEQTALLPASPTRPTRPPSPSTTRPLTPA